jgi:hypothetical protein
VEAFDRTNGCFEGWRGAERGVAGVVLAVVVVSWAWEVSFSEDSCLGENGKELIRDCFRLCCSFCYLLLLRMVSPAMW